MTDASCIHEELIDLETSLRSDLQMLTLAPRGARGGEIMDRVSKNIAMHHRLLHRLRQEVRLFDDDTASKTRRAEFERRLREHQNECTALNKMAWELKSQAAAGGATDPEDPSAGSAGAGGSTRDGIPDPSRQHAKALAGNVTNVQDDTIRTAQDALRLVIRTENTAGDATEALRRQGQELTGIKEDLRTMDGNVKRARREMSAFVRRQMGDRLVLVFMFLVLAGIIAMIIVRLVRK